MDPAKIFGRSISFPPRIGPGGRVEWSSGEENIRESIEVILRTQLSERIRLPEFGGGLESLLFEPNIAATHRLIEDNAGRALKRWEPRIRVETIHVEAGVQRSEAVVTIQYQLVATRTTESASLTVRLGG